MISVVADEVGPGCRVNPIERLRRLSGKRAERREEEERDVINAGIEDVVKSALAVGGKCHASVVVPVVRWLAKVCVQATETV